MVQSFYELTYELSERIQPRLRARINARNQKKLQNRDFSLICSNCNGGFILHDLHLQFRSPTVNLWFEPGDFLEFLSHLQEYLRMEPVFSDELEARNGYPVGVLNGKVKLYFQHYGSREEALAKWTERSRRVDLKNLFILFSDRDGCTESQLKEFDALPYPNKVVFTHLPHPELKSAWYIRGFEEEAAVGMCFQYKSQFSGKKYYDDFPYVPWFNGQIPRV